jgi:hypothetical protein
MKSSKISETNNRAGERSFFFHFDDAKTLLISSGEDLTRCTSSEQPYIRALTHPVSTRGSAHSTSHLAAVE